MRLSPDPTYDWTDALLCDHEVDLLDHGVDRGHSPAIAPARAALVFANKPHGSLERIMGRCVREDQSKGGIGVLPHETDRLVPQHARQVAAFRRILVASVAHQVPAPVILGAVRIAEKVVESAPMRQVVFIVEAVVPLADQGRPVTSLAKPIAEGLL